MEYYILKNHLIQFNIIKKLIENTFNCNFYFPITKAFEDSAFIFEDALYNQMYLNIIKKIKFLFKFFKFDLYIKLKKEYIQYNLNYIEYIPFLIIKNLKTSIYYFNYSIIQYKIIKKKNEKIKNLYNYINKKLIYIYFFYTIFTFIYIFFLVIF
jgi:hypothetical protein